MKKTSIVAVCSKDICCSKIIRIMRNTLLLLLINVFHIFANSSYSQTAKLTISLHDATVKEILTQIEDQSEFYFLYNSKLINVNRKTDIEVENEKIGDVLTSLFYNTDVNYVVFNRQIILSQKDYIASLKEETAQSSTVTGKVTDENGDPVIGATVSILGTSVGAITDQNGNYTLRNVPEGAILRFSFIGMLTQEIEVDGKTVIDVVLLKDVIGIDEVVVIGYGTKSRKTLTGSVSTIDEEQLDNRPTTKTTDLLQGMAAGVQILRGNSARVRGTNNQITIRGTTSRSNPGVLVVIDGIPQADNSAYALDNINPKDIESINILKDAQASIYGARASGGVILITTKKGKEGKPTIDFTADYTLQKPSLMRKPVNILQQIEMHNEAWVNDGQEINLWTHIVQYVEDNNLTFNEIAKNEGKYIVRWPFDLTTNMVFGHYDWSDIMYETKPMQSYNLAVSGRTDRLNYYNSISFVDQQAMLDFGTNYNKRLFVRLNNDFKVNDYLKVKTNFNLERQKVLEPTGYELMEIYVGNTWANHMPYTPEGNLYGMGTILNPIGFAEKSGSQRDINFRINSKVGMDITPFKNFTFTGEVASNFDILENEWANLGFDNYNENDVLTLNSTQNRNSAGSIYHRSRYTVANAFGKYTLNNLGNHKIDIMAGYAHEEEDIRSFSAERRLGLISPELPTFVVGSAEEQYTDERKLDRALNSFFSRLSYDYKDKYLMEGIFRYDGSSKFAEGHKWSPFWAVSGAWVVSNEDFMENISETINFLKLRASWGIVGNQASIGRYDYIARINIGGSYPMGNPLNPLLTERAILSGMASNERSWEKIESKNIGLDISILESRLSGSFDYYIKDNRDMFYSKEFPEVLGVVPPSINGAHVRSSGWDLLFGWRDKIGDFGYSINLNLSNNNSEVIDLADSRIPSVGLNQFVEGYPVASYFGYRFAGLIKDDSQLADYNSYFSSGIPGNLQLGDVMYKDLDGDNILKPQAYEVDDEGNPTPNSGDLDYLGDAGQHYLFGVTLGGNWKNFDLKLFFQGVLKWNVMESNYAIHNMVLAPEDYFYHNTWSPDRPDALYPRLTQDFGPKYYNYEFSDAPFKLFNNSYVRLKNIQFGYTFPAGLVKRMKINTFRIYFSGEDLWEWYDLPGNQDPEKPFPSRFFNPIPFARGFTFGINLNF